MSPSGQFAAAIENVGDIINVWDVKTGSPLAELSSSSSRYRASLAFSPDSRWLVASGGDDVQVFDTGTWKAVRTIPAPQIGRLTFDPVRSRLATSDLTSITIWGIPSGDRLQTMSLAGERISHFSFSSDGASVIVSGAEGTQRIWNTTTGVLEKPSTRGVGGIWAEFNKSGQWIASARSAVTISEISTGLPLATLEGTQAGITSVTFDPSGSLVAGLSEEGIVTVWDSSSQFRRWSSQAIDVDCRTPISSTEDSRFIAIGCRQHGTYIWDTDKDLLLAELPRGTPVSKGFWMAFPVVSSDGALAAIAQGADVEIYRLPAERRGNRPIRTIRHPASVSSIAFAPAAHDLISGAIDGSVGISRDGQETTWLPSVSGGVDVVGLAPTGHAVVTSTKGMLRMYSPTALQQTIEAPLGMRAYSLRFSATDRMIVIPEPGKQSPPILWDLRANRIISRLDNHKGRLASARFVRDGGEILTTGGDGVTRRWNAESGAFISLYSDSAGLQFDATLSPDGTRLVTAGADGVLRFWDLERGHILWVIQADKSINGVHFSGRDLITRGYAGALARWAIPDHTDTSLERVLRCTSDQVEEGFEAEACD